MSYYSVVVYVETLVQKGAGFYTPISLLSAVDFFAKAFGFDIDAKAWSRSKRLALRYKGQKGERRPAKSFSEESLRALKKMVKDDSGFRQAASLCASVHPPRRSPEHPDLCPGVDQAEGRFGYRRPGQGF